MENEWRRADAHKKCPVCGKHDWCLIATNESAAICPRTEQGSVAYIEGSGWLHKFGDDKDPKPRLRAAPKPLPEHNSVLSTLYSKMRKHIDKETLVRLSDNLSLSPKCLDLMGVGYSPTKNAYAFPMLRAGNRFLGIRFRTYSGQKFAAKGSKQGLFVPSSFNLSRGVIVCEGPTDTAAMLELGFNAIGRASCNSGNRLIKEIVKNNPVAIISDTDEVGRAGAKKLSQQIPKSVVIEPDKYKDAREWVVAGATRQTVMEKIAEDRN